MADLDLIRQLGDLLGRPLKKISEKQFERHRQAQYAWNGAQEQITQDAYCVAGNGIVIGLFLQPVTSELLFNFSLQKFSCLKYLHLERVSLSSYSFLSSLENLTTLNLRSNQISDCSFLSELKNLTTLDLRSNQISDCSFLSELKNLTTLDLRSNQISDCSFLDELNNLKKINLSDNQISEFSSSTKKRSLTILHLSANQISDFSFLSEFENLTTLDLCSNQIADCAFLRELKDLTELYLSANQISDCSFLSELKGLTKLYLSSNQISDCSSVSKLKDLTELDLSNNHISDCSFLSGLECLTALYLSSNQISDCSFLSELKGLTRLDLSDNQISDCSVLGKLKYLTRLYLSINQISDFSSLSQLEGLITLYLSANQISDCSFLSGLRALTRLDLSTNQISDCSVLSKLKGLTMLNLRANRISECSFLSELKDLAILYLSANRISDCSVLSKLTDLTTLYLNDNRISDCSFLSGLRGLTTLYLNDNQIQTIPKSFAQSRLAITAERYVYSGYININDNPIETPPLEIVSEGNSAILNYYAQSEAQGQDYLYEAKMLIVGEGEAGKTTLAHKILEPNCPLPYVDDRTKGISIKTYIFPCLKKDHSEKTNFRSFYLNIWDFGGQEIYHATHRFFLSKRSLYVLVADNRKDDTDFNYWLNIIECFAGNSPLIVVLNEKGDIQRSLNRSELLSRYADSVKEIVPVNFKTHEEQDQNKAQQRLKDINRLIGDIEYHAQSLDHIGDPVPARWVNVRQSIEEDNRDHIYREQFDEICQAHDITAGQDIDTLLSYFHDLGILLHFADNPLLRNRVILKPAWATNAVYRIFDDDTIKAKLGRFSRRNCADIWHDPQYSHMHDVLIELMKNFRLVYEIENTGNLVAPQMLPKNTPAYDWDSTHNSHMQLRYDAFMPKSIFSQLVVRMHRYIENHDWVWRNGMVIRRCNTWAEIKEDLNLRRIFLRFSGPSISEFRAVIIDQLDIISQSYHRLHYDKMIPCSCDECKDSDDPHFFTFRDLKKRQEQRKKDTIECVKSTEDVRLSVLLEGFDNRAILKHLPDNQGDEPAPPPSQQTREAPVPQTTIQTIEIFLASSSELKADREQFEIFISRQNDYYIERGTRLKLVIWEKFLNAMSKTRSQDEYNEAIAGCDIFILLAHTKVGQYTDEEFLVALETFKDSDRPFIFTYFKDTAINMSRITPEIMTLLNFKQKLSDMGHFYQHYADINDLKQQLDDQLKQCLPKLTAVDV